MERHSNFGTFKAAGLKVLIAIGLFLATGCMEVTGPAQQTNVSQSLPSSVYMKAAMDSAWSPADSNSTGVVEKVGTTTLKVTFQTVVPAH